MIPVDLIAVLGTVVFAGLFVGSSLLAGSGFGLEKRATLLERRDPGTAAALRRAQFMSDFPSGGVFGDEGFSAICTPSRRSGLDMARIPATNSGPPPPASVDADARGGSGGGWGEELGPPADRQRVADERHDVDDPMRDDERHHAPPARVAPAEHDAHRDIPEERPEALVEVVAAAQHRAREDGGPAPHAEF